jgi:hypothetical protein
MSTEAHKSLRSNGPYDGKPGATSAALATDYGVIKWTGGVAATETTHSANAMPQHWQGREVGLTATGGVCHVAFSQDPTAEVDRAVSATAAGASLKVGLPVPDSLSVMTRIRVPSAGNNTIYFVRESSATGTIVYMQLLD